MTETWSRCLSLCFVISKIQSNHF